MTSDNTWNTDVNMVTVTFSNGETEEHASPVTQADVKEIAERRGYSNFNVIVGGVEADTETTEITEDFSIEEYNQAKGIKGTNVWSI